MSIIEGLDLHTYKKKKENEDFIRIYNNFLDKDLCDLLINFYNKNEKHECKLTTMADEDGTEQIDGIRKSNGLNVDNLKRLKINNTETSIIFNIIFNIFDKGIKRYLNEFKYCINVKEFVSEELIITKYIKNKGYFKWHKDRGLMKNSANHRYLSAILYLNDVDIGGETEFKYQNKIIKPLKGQLLIFPSDWTYLHRGRIPESNDKYICNNFFELS